MRTQSAFIIWTAMVLYLSLTNGQTTDSSADMSSPLNQLITKDGATSKSDNLESQPSTADPSVSSPRTDFWSGAVTPPGPPPSQSPSSPQSPASRDDTDTASAPGRNSSESSLTVSYLKSTVSASVVTTASAAPTTFVTARESHQTVSTSTSGVTQTAHTAPTSTPTHPHTSQFVLTSSSKVTSSKVTGPAPLEDQDEPSELDVGDQDSGKAPHHPASPLDPLLAALVTIFIICTAMVSAVLFLRFRQRSEHPEFHRLQDLPMDDLLEDTPLSRYHY